MKFCIVLKFLIVLNTNLIIKSQRTAKLKYFDSSRQSIQFPNDSNDETNEETSNDNSLESILIRTSHMTHLNELLEEFGVLIASRGRGPAFGEQASCQPELRSVSLPELESSEPEVGPNSIYFPKCVRIARCGGCCGGASHLMQCVPKKISYKNIKRAHIRVKRSDDGRAVPDVSQETIRVEVHEECGCECRVHRKHCNPYLHKYRQEVCKCECLNTNDQFECKQLAKNRVWDNSECRCKCIGAKLCSTGRYFSHDTCSCIEDSYELS